MVVMGLSHGSAVPARARRQITERELAVWVVDAAAVATAAGLGKRVNTVLQTGFFALAGLLPTDEAVIAWGDLGLPELNTQVWGTTNGFISTMYNRIFYQVALANEFLVQTSDAKLTERGVSASLRADIQIFRAEARFLRALSYWHGLDMFGNIPVVTTPTLTPPPQNTRQEVYDFIVSELAAIQADLPAATGAGTYGRATKEAGNMLLAKVYLNDRVRDALIETLYGSGSNLLILPIQDVFGWLDRINQPATVNTSNWTWRLPWPVDRLATERGAFA